MQEHWGVQRELPAEAISNWLENPSDVMKINDRKPKEKLLKIWIDDHDDIPVPNASEMIEHLKIVCLIDLIMTFYSVRNLGWTLCTLIIRL